VIERSGKAPGQPSVNASETAKAVRAVEENDAVRDLARGQTVEQVVKQLGVTVQTYYRWRKEYGGLRMDQAKRLKDLEKENARLKRLVAEAELDKAILKEAALGN